LSDKSRFACDGLKRQRLIAPMLRKPDGEFEAVEWESALITIAQALKGAGKGQIAAVAGSLCDAESMVALKDLINRLGSDTVCTEQKFPTGGKGAGFRSTYLLNSSIAAVEEADTVLLVGTNPRYEAPLLNTRLRKGYVHNEQCIGLIGPDIDLSYDYEVKKKWWLKFSE
jgi:NADH dehydrogenase (ubiquinone) Fe-S protein 1